MKKFIVIGAIFLLALALIGCRAEEASFEDGIYLGSGRGHQGDIEVEVVVGDGSISEVNVLSHNDTAGIADGAIEGISDAIIEGQSVEVDAVSGATNTSNGIIDAVKDALAK
ncbi:FMN-binding protein [Halonatronum saccharophilum]|uniref:FMN-binding protein n=1 Tax=Halonatronum saccharophilum TaxID=150060 RepID=UPI00047FC905|nr:FMN-binding protein [Halonatronum saccharophilum]